MNDPKFKRKRTKILKLIRNGANPNVVAGFSADSLLYKAVLHDDLEVAQCCLERGAKIHQPHSDQLIERAESVAVLQLLVDYNADLNYKIPRNGGMLLHNAATFGYCPTVIDFLCNSGLDANAQDDELSTPLHNVLGMCGAHTSKRIRHIIMALLWHGAQLDRENNKGETALVVLQRRFPGWVNHYALTDKFKALDTVVPRVKAQH